MRNSFPFLKYVVFFILGIISCIFLDWNFGVYFTLSCSIIIISFHLVFKNKFLIQQTFASLLLLFLFGNCLTNNHIESKNAKHLINYNGKVAAYYGTIISEIEIKKNTQKFELKLDQIINQDHIKSPASAKILVYVSKKDFDQNYFNYGDKVLVKGSPDLITPPINPGEFDLKRFYSFHQIYHRDFVSKDNLIKISSSTPSWIMKVAIEMRKKSEYVFANFIHSEREQRIASALILGIKSSLDYEISSAYSATGTMHVLAVSGMHVGIIYQILIWITAFCTRFKYGKYISSTIQFLALWFYAFLTGLSPSVLRAVAMFSLIVVAKLIKRDSHIFNTLSIAAFGLLCFNPFYIMEVGFQLSFLAVLGIVYLHPKIYELFTIKNKVLDWFWSITCISLVAQLATFPVSLLYFHQFPNYFILSNLIVIPASIVIMYIGLGFLALSHFEILGNWLGYGIEKSVWFLNQIIFFMQKLPYAATQMVAFSTFETILLYLIIASIIFVFVQKSKPIIWISVLLIFIFSANRIYQKNIASKQSFICLFHVHQGFAINFVDGRDDYLLASQSVIDNPEKYQFHISNARIKWFLKSIDLKNQNNNQVVCKEIPFGKIIYYHQKLIIQSEKKYHFDPKSKLLETDLLVLSNNSVKTLKWILKSIKPKIIVIDGSNSSYLALKLEKEALSYGIKVHVTQKDGALMIT